MPDLRIGVIQLTIEPVPQMVTMARALDDAGFDSIWLGDAHQWFRKRALAATRVCTLD